MATFAMMEWAWGLRGLQPLDKLVALYFAGNAGAAEGGEGGAMDVAAHDLAEWCGAKKEDVVTALFALQRHGVRVREIDVWLYRVELGLGLRDPPPRMSDAGEAPHYLYVVSTPTGVKIGITGNIAGRMKSLRNASPELMNVEFTAVGPRRKIEWAEARCHADLQPHHIRGEWFSCGPAMAVAVARAVLEEAGVVLP
jgi:hypothetical protein